MSTNVSILGHIIIVKTILIAIAKTVCRGVTVVICIISWNSQTFLFEINVLYIMASWDNDANLLLQ